MMRIYQFLLLLLGISINAQNLTSSQNYVYSRTMLEGVDKNTSESQLQSKKQQQSVNYVDGLGRPLQTIDIKSTRQGYDVVTRFEYDQLGRQVKDFLPLPQLSNEDGKFYSVIDSTNGSVLYDATILYSKKGIESSPLNRVLEQRGPGAWSATKTSMVYDLNTSGEVKKFLSTYSYSTNTASSLQVSSYDADELYKTTTTDEDGNQTTEFKNGKGQVLLIRKLISSGVKPGPAETPNLIEPATFTYNYYVYNNYDQLAFVITPKAVEQIGNATVVSQAILDDLCYQYIYNNRNLLVEKKLPGKGREYMLYDSQDRLVAVQDAELRKLNRWLFTKYDQLGRILYTGISEQEGNGTRADEQAKVFLKGNNQENRTSTTTTINGQAMEYTVTGAYPARTKIKELLTVNYYDTYPAGTPAWASVQSPAPVILTDNASSELNTKNLPTGTFVKVIGPTDNRWNRSYIYYDSKARPIGGYTRNHLGGFTKTESKLDFAGLPLEIYTTHSRSNTTTQVTIKERFEYDNQNRLLKHYHNVNNASVDELLTDNTYDELGRVTSKQVGAGLQQMDFSYNTLGWMTGINKANLSNLSGRLFAYEVKYNNPANPDYNLARYNGNISEVDWNTGGGIKRYGYDYDGINRLTYAKYQTPGSVVPMLGLYDEELQYDANGNITMLKRSAPPFVIPGPATELIDNLAYLYNGNRVTNITDATGNPSGYEGGGGTITYDDNGSMTNMPDKAITNITYNHLSLPKSMSLPSDQTMGYQYTADGNKVMKSLSHTEGTTVTTITTDYLDGFHYKRQNGFTIQPEMRTPVASQERAFQAVEETETQSMTLTATPQLEFFPTAEGFYDFANSKYIYQYKDHLGNVRVSFARKTDRTGIDIIDNNDYYPFGMNHYKGETSSMFGLGGNYVNYKYNGKELQETGMYDYGARFYMPDIGKFGTHDPLSEKTMEPYAYVYNNPVKFIDPTGMKGVDVSTSHDIGYGRTVTYLNSTTSLSGSAGTLVGLNDIKIDDKGLVSDVKTTNRERRFFDDKGQRLEFNDPDGVDNRAMYQSYKVNDRVYHPISKNEVLDGISKVESNTKIMTALIQAKVGIAPHASLLRAYALIIKESMWGNTDFSTKYLSKKLGLEGTSVYINDSSYHIRFGGTNTIYSLMDAGNFMWGAWSKFIGLHAGEVWAGSNLNELSKGGFDSKADQRAINAGRKYLFK